MIEPGNTWFVTMLCAPLEPSIAMMPRDRSETKTGAGPITDSAWAVAGTHAKARSSRTVARRARFTMAAI